MITQACVLPADRFLPTPPHSTPPHPTLLPLPTPHLLPWPPYNMIAPEEAVFPDIYQASITLLIGNGGAVALA